MKPGSAGQGTTDGDDTERPGLRERKKERVREQIRQAALDLFDQRDFDSVTVDEIAERAEVSKSTLFRYFETKEDLVFANSRTYGDTLLAAFAAHGSREMPVWGDVFLRLNQTNAAIARQRVHNLTRYIAALQVP